MLLSNPGFVRSCDDCQKWMYAEGANEPSKQRLSDQPAPRPPGVGTPCITCPKCAHSLVKSPEVGRTTELSYKNWMTWKLYNRMQATFGKALEPDAIQSRNFGVIFEVIQSHRLAAERKK